MSEVIDGSEPTRPGGGRDAGSGRGAGVARLRSCGGLCGFRDADRRAGVAVGASVRAADRDASARVNPRSHRLAAEYLNGVNPCFDSKEEMLDAVAV